MSRGAAGDDNFDCNGIQKFKGEKLQKCKGKKTHLGVITNDPNTEQSSSETKDVQDDIVIQSLSVAISAINATKDLIPIDLAKGILGTVANILTIAQLVIKNKSDFQAIVNKCETIREILERSTKDATNDDLPGYLRHALLQLNISVNRINSEVSTKKEQGFFKRLFSVTINRDHISGWEKDLDHVLVLFNAGAIAGIVIRVEKLALGLEGNATNINVSKYRSKEPPSRPSMFYGQDDLVAELMDLIVNDEHIALIGPGGMGKSSLAKAILNETLVRERFADRHYFVAYDGLDPSTITFDAFMTHFAGVLGIELAEIADIPGVILILTSCSQRNAPNVEWITKDIPPLDSSAARQAFFRIYRPTSVSNAEGEITKLLAELDFHPLSINLLANAAQQHGWSPATLLERWNNRHSIVLNHGKGKLQSLSYTMNLSLGSPSVQELGEDGRRALAVIAFLPQGLNADLASDLLPSLLQVDTICDVLCRQSLVYHQDSFIKVLAPIRHFVRDSLPPLDSTCLRDIRDFYYNTVGCCSEDRDRYADMIISDHLNIEHVVAFDLAHIPDGKEETYEMCWLFLWCLYSHLPRPTTLAPAIFNIVENSSTWVPKANCLSQLAWLYVTLSQPAEQMKAFKAAQALYLTAGDHESVAECVARCAETYRSQGHFLQSQQVFEDFQNSTSWKFLSEAMKAQSWYFLDDARQHTFTVPADELFVKSWEDRTWGLQSKVLHWRVKLYYGGDIVQVKTHLENLSRQSQQIGGIFDRREALRGLAEVAFCNGRLSDAMDILEKIVEMFEGQHSDDVLWYTVWRGVVASRQGNHVLARELVHQASGSLEVFALCNARTFLHSSYASACIELTAGEFDKAKSHFNATIESCDMQDSLTYKAFVLSRTGRAFRRDTLLPFYALLDRFEGWASFLEGQVVIHEHYVDHIMTTYPYHTMTQTVPGLREGYTSWRESKAEIYYHWGNLGIEQSLLL
ncbi:hypothetical protein DFH29DRAFT_1073146 [Suillus ampliporus]|nr:hypothetical protein DFH29DRAFT_1073146 [Suillus ampliporus]